MKKFLKNLLMKHLIDIVINQDFQKMIIFSKFNKYLFVTKHTKTYFWQQILNKKGLVIIDF